MGHLTCDLQAINEQTYQSTLIWLGVVQQFL